MHIVDLSTPIVENHFRWPVERRMLRNHDENNVQSTWAGWIAHGFTHMDSPRHVVADGLTTDAISMDRVVGPAAVVDASAVAPRGPITADMVAAAGAHVREGDIVLLRTRWDEKESIDTEDFWRNAPYVTNEAAEWLRDAKIKAIAFDFPQDYCIRYFLTGEKRPALPEHPTHYHLLRNGIIMFEYLRNMGAIEGERTFFVGLPLKLPDSDGSPARAIAIEGLDVEIAE
jgi:kynurenine formamidase